MLSSHPTSITTSSSPSIRKESDISGVSFDGLRVLSYGLPVILGLEKVISLTNTEKISRMLIS